MTADTSPKASGTAKACNVATLDAPSTIALRTNVATVESTAPDTAWGSSMGAPAVLAPMVAIVARLETKPNANTVTARPSWLPNIRIAICPAALIAMIRIATAQILCGLIAANGPM